ncbi:hypothetical protein LTR15_011612 [Elasticomyces elasticus]|nr:hypothetical protein LTR15_011612 [Elasticomyces elasticus]
MAGSKPCQKEDWPIHQKMCKVVTNPKGRNYGGCLGINPYEGKHPGTLVWLRGDSPTGHLDFVISPCFRLESVNDSHFEDLPITRALGFPLGYSPDATGLSHCVNIIIQLFVDIDTTSPRLGMAIKAPVGGACLARHDRKYMKILHVEALINYVEAANLEIALVPEREKSGEKVDREEIVERLLTPEAFARAFETFKQDKVRNGEVWWANLECPVKVGGGEVEEKQD